MYTVLFTLKNATQYTLYTQKTILYFRITDKNSVIAGPVVYSVGNQFNIPQGFIIVFLIYTAAVCCSVQILVGIWVGGFQFKQIAAGDVCNVTCGLFRVAGG